MILEKNNYSKKALINKTVLITGGGGGIGYEASRAFSYIGAKVIIAEIDAMKGRQTQKRINEEFRNENVDFYQIDISSKNQIDNLYKYILDKYTQLDVIIHNAAVVPMGAISAVPISDWDLSYAVNLRAPVLITQKFLPSMGISTEDFYKSQEDYIVDAEIAGVGYAVSVVNARQYHGKEIMSYQVLQDSGLLSGSTTISDNKHVQADYDKLLKLFTNIADVFFDQYQGWQKKKLFQKQFILSDFKKQMGIPAESFNKQLEIMQIQIQNSNWDDFLNNKKMFVKWKNYYIHQIKLLEGYEKDMKQLANDTKLLNSWIGILQDIIDILQKP